MRPQQSELEGGKVSPELTIGVPVYNGANYLTQTLRCLVGLSPRVRLVVSDNASEDSTQAIVNDCTADDGSVLYVRQQENIGAGANYDAVFSLAKTEYFAWNAHDDLRHPSFVESSLAALRSGDVIGCVSDMLIISETGEPLEICRAPDALQSTDPVERVLAALQTDPEIVVFGAFRRTAMKNTDLHGRYTGSDRILAGQLALLGPMAVIHQPLFELREHPERSVHQRTEQSKFRHTREEWFSPDRGARIVFPNWLRLRKLLAMPFSPGLGMRDRLRLLVRIANFVVRSPLGPGGRLLLWDLAVAGATLVRRIPTGE